MLFRFYPNSISKNFLDVALLPYSKSSTFFKGLLLHFSGAPTYVIGIKNYGLATTFFTGWLVSKQISVICLLPRLLQHHLFTEFSNPGETPLSPTRSHLLWIK
jgi:hypothetical protein